MKKQLLFTFLTFLICLYQKPLEAQYFETLYGHPAESGILNGTPKTFLVTGYSTSHTPAENGWTVVLQEMLHQHAGNDETYFVFKHTIGGTPIAKWTDICGTGQHVLDALEMYVNPGSNIPAGLPTASVMLAQQSLQWAFGDCQDRFIGIESAGDQPHIEQGTDAILYYNRQFLDAGIERVYMATHIYKSGNYPLSLCGEKYALEVALDSLPDLKPGPELCEITETMFPWGFANDMVHPDTEVAHAMALYWYLVLAGENADADIAQTAADVAGIEVPEGIVTSVSENDVENPDLEIFPNPAQYSISINAQNSETSLMEIFDVTGTRVFHSSLELPQTSSIDVSDFRKGIYFVHVHAEHKTYVEKIIVY